MEDIQISTTRKRLVYGGLKGLTNHIARLEKGGWQVVMTQICYQTKSKKVYIAELTKDNEAISQHN